MSQRVDRRLESMLTPCSKSKDPKRRFETRQVSPSNGIWCIRLQVVGGWSKLSIKVYNRLQNVFGVIQALHTSTYQMAFHDMRAGATSTCQVMC